MEENVFDISKIKTPKIPAKLIGMGILAIVLLLLAFSSFYQVEPEEEGVVLRFGEFTRTAPPGLHFKIPLVEEVLLVPVQRQLKQEFGFRTIEADVRSSYRRVDDESLMLTGDLNVAVVEWIVQYRVSDSYNYLFKVRSLTDTFRAMNEAVMRSVVGDRTVTEVLTVGRQEIELSVKERLQELCEQYETGITVDQVVLQDVNPPDLVKPSWDQVNQAQQQRDRLINQAQTEFNQVIPRASGEAEQTILQAEGYAVDRVNRSQGDAQRFKELVAEYRRAPQVTRQRMYLETIEKVLPLYGGKLFLDSEAEGVLPLLPIETLKTITNPGANRPAPSSSSGQGGGQ
ncbi:MAG TPA: FtsH protease activity modulator HflK [Acidobacteriota bacterium]|nr:FtsH protease activity modulator HflK [Acidobacteriota bacterium]